MRKKFWLLQIKLDRKILILVLPEVSKVWTEGKLLVFKETDLKRVFAASLECVSTKALLVMFQNDFQKNFENKLFFTIIL
jgi:hypothetical protein